MDAFKSCCPCCCETKNHRCGKAAKGSIQITPPRNYCSTSTCSTKKKMEQPRKKVWWNPITTVCLVQVLLSLWNVWAPVWPVCCCAEALKIIEEGLRNSPSYNSICCWKFWDSCISSNCTSCDPLGHFTLHIHCKTNSFDNEILARLSCTRGRRCMQEWENKKNLWGGDYQSN